MLSLAARLGGRALGAWTVTAQRGFRTALRFSYESAPTPYGPCPLSGTSLE
jgi:hypothetical protein